MLVFDEVVRSCSCRPPPNVYKQVDDAARIRALEQFMEGKGLSRHSTPAEIAVRHSHPELGWLLGDAAAATGRETSSRCVM